jgi:tetratricopeptide (TPR) repeat protein
MRGLLALLLLPPFLLVACTHTAPALKRPPIAVPGHKSGATAPTATVPAPSASAAVATAPAPGLSYRLPKPAQTLADGAQVPAVQGLLAAADRAMSRQDYEAAAVSLERAQRLAPQSVAVYQRFTEVRLRQRRPAEAEQMARKALAYASTTAQQAALWRQMALARQQLGRAQLAQDALLRAQALEASAVSAP